MFDISPMLGQSFRTFATARNADGDNELKEKVKSLLIKWGNNPQDVEKMISKEFEYAARKYSTPAKIAEAIRYLY